MRNSMPASAPHRQRALPVLTPYQHATCPWPRQQAQQLPSCRRSWTSNGCCPGACIFTILQHIWGLATLSSSMVPGLCSLFRGSWARARHVAWLTCARSP